MDIRSLVMASNQNIRPTFFKDMVDSQPQAFKTAYRHWTEDPGALSALEALNMPFEAAGQYAGDSTLDATNSPAAATAAYLAGSGMLGTMPLKGAEKAGHAGLEMLHNGIAYGQGPFSGLQYLAPGVMKREGGNWFPGEIDKVVHNLQQHYPVAESQEWLDWVAGPMKNYIQKRFASPNDEIRKLYDQDIHIVPEQDVGYRTMQNIEKKRRKFGDPALTDLSMGETAPARSWEYRADNMITPDVALLDAARAANPMPKYLSDWAPKERIGAETLKYLRRKKATNILPSEILGQDINRTKMASKDVASAIADYIKQNKQILNSLRETDTDIAKKVPWAAHREVRDTYGWDSPQAQSLIDQDEYSGTAQMTKRLGRSLDEAYQHLDQPIGTLYKGHGFKYGNNLRYDPFSGQDINLSAIRSAFGRGEPWIANVPEDNPINSFTTRLYGENDVAEMPEFRHMFDVMSEDLLAGRLTPQQLKSGSFSVEAAARRAAEYNADKIKNMEKTRLIEAEGFPTIKQYDNGYKWLELKHKDSPDATGRALKEEGNAMGHCVGSYCDPVLAGKKRIISLRNDKGQPRVTVELARIGEGNNWGINQIKGPANRKPSAADIPMIQDFIKNNGPYGIINDYHNAELLRLDELSRGANIPGMTEEGLPPAAIKALADWAKEMRKTSDYIDRPTYIQKYKEITGEDIPKSYWAGN